MSYKLWGYAHFYAMPPLVERTEIPLETNHIMIGLF